VECNLDAADSGAITKLLAASMSQKATQIAILARYGWRGQRDEPEKCKLGHRWRQL